MLKRQKSDVELNGWMLALRVGLGLLILISLASSASSDPSPLNLVWPPGGVKNWLGLPGALLSGLLLDTFGWSSLLIPFSLIFLRRKKKIPFLVASVQNIISLCLFTAFIGLLFPEKSEYFFSLSGFWGDNAFDSLTLFPGRWISLVLIICYLARKLWVFEFNGTVLSLSLQSLLLLSLIVTQFATRLKDQKRKLFGILSINWMSFARTIHTKCWSVVKRVVPFTKRAPVERKPVQPSDMSATGIRQVFKNIAQTRGRAPGEGASDKTTVARKTDRAILGEALEMFESTHLREFLPID